MTKCINLTKYVIICSMARQESERFRVPEGTFEAFERAFVGLSGEKEYCPGVYRGEPRRVLASLHAEGLVRIARHEPDLDVFIHEQVGSIRLGVLYTFVLRRDNSVEASISGYGPFPIEALLENVALRRMIPPEPDQAKVEQLFSLAQHTITLGR